MQYFYKTDSAALIGTIHIGRQINLARGPVLRPLVRAVSIGTKSCVLENKVLT